MSAQTGALDVTPIDQLRKQITWENALYLVNKNIPNRLTTETNKLILGVGLEEQVSK